ncbi:MAG: PEP-CTERM sorting domain-containing protein [Nitrospirales bacterium]|nr:PEP-CTERM sorting domain-containing protein [Nitrospira sp.]MDR4501044.1 PEP-CTERM sorting domain-containing protein [Nitrospirales bacterium]
MGTCMNPVRVTRGLTAMLAALAFCGGVGSTASAGSIIFEDNFDRGHYGSSATVGNGWGEIQRDYNDVAIDHSHLLLRDTRPGGGVDAGATHEIDTTGYQNVYVMYDFKPLKDSDPNDYLYVDFRTLGSQTWTTLASHSLGGNQWAWNTAYFGSSGDNTLLQLRFWTDVTEDSWFYGSYRAGEKEGAYIDALKVWGDPKPMAATPEPSTMALFATGMVGMGLWRMRKNKADGKSAPCSD